MEGAVSCLPLPGARKQDVFERRAIPLTSIKHVKDRFGGPFSYSAR